MTRCEWAGSDPLMVAYHDQEWGRPLHDERRLFEMLCLEGAQAGLSWSTILKRREGYRAAYDDFDAERIAAYDDERQAQLLSDERIIRNRAKVRAFRDNATATLRLRREAGGLDAYLWDFVGGRPIVDRFVSLAEIPAQTPLAEAISKDLRKRGFRFVGPVITYAFMQSVGLVNDHLVSCFGHPEAETRTALD
jgi:DNA-3-methyladenine glycosylase I